METNRYIGKEFGSYRLVEKLDSGGFGSVYLARHMVLPNRVVAVKLLHMMYLDSEEVRASFLEEARLLEMLKHPSILPIIDINIAEDGFPYLVTEYAPGGSLRGRMRARKSGPFSLNEALQILTQTGAGLSYAHERNIIHRDLKPENILFNEKGEALLADFGLATTLATASEKYVSASGTPAYMAPEQFKGLVSKESDQYALGCIAYELLTGQKPFLGNNAVEMMYQHLHEQPAPPTSLNAKLPSSIERILLKTIAKTRQERFASIRQFIQELEEAVQTEEAEGKLATEPVLSLWETKQTGKNTTAEEWRTRLVAVEQEQESGKNVRSSASTVDMTLKKESGRVLPLSSTIDKDKTENSSQTTRKLEPETAGTQAISAGKKASIRKIIAVAAALITIIALLTPVVTATLLHARGSSSQGRSGQPIGFVGTSPNISATTTAKVETPAVTKTVVTIKPTTAPVVGAPTPLLVPTPTLVTGAPTPLLVPTPTPLVVPTPTLVPTPTPTPIPAIPAKLLVSKSSLQAEDNCSWGGDNSVSSWSCTEILSNVAGAKNSINWSSSATGNSSNSLPATIFSPTSGTIRPGQSTTVSILVEGQGKTSCVTPSENLIFTSSTNSVSIPWSCSGPMPTISPTSLGGASHAGCSLDTSGSNWLCTVTITAHKQGLDIWGGSSTGINGISFGDPGYGYFGGANPSDMLHAVSIGTTIPVVNCPATATITISTSFSTFDIPWSC